MTTEAPALTTLSGEMPSIWREAVPKQLRPQENVLATLEVDLDQQLRFVKGLVVLTNQINDGTIVVDSSINNK